MVIGYDIKISIKLNEKNINRTDSFKNLGIMIQIDKKMKQK